MNLSEYLLLSQKLERGLNLHYGKRISIRKLKVILHYSSVDAVVAALNKGHLPLEVYGTGDLSSKSVLATDLVKYIVNQYFKSKINRGE